MSKQEGAAGWPEEGIYDASLPAGARDRWRWPLSPSTHPHPPYYTRAIHHLRLFFTYFICNVFHNFYSAGPKLTPHRTRPIALFSSSSSSFFLPSFLPGFHAKSYFHTQNIELIYENSCAAAVNKLELQALSQSRHLLREYIYLHAHISLYLGGITRSSRATVHTYAKGSRWRSPARVWSVSLIYRHRNRPPL